MTQIQISFGPSSLPALMGLTSSRSFKECSASYVVVVVNWWHILCRQSRADPKNEKKDRHKELIDRDSSSAGKKSVPFLSLNFPGSHRCFSTFCCWCQKKWHWCHLSLSFSFLFSQSKKELLPDFLKMFIFLSFLKKNSVFLNWLIFGGKNRSTISWKQNHKKYEWLFFTNYQSIAKTSLSSFVTKTC